MQMFFAVEQMFDKLLLLSRDRICLANVPRMIAHSLCMVGSRLSMHRKGHVKLLSVDVYTCCYQTTFLHRKIEGIIRD